MNKCGFSNRFDEKTIYATYLLQKRCHIDWQKGNAVLTFQITAVQYAWFVDEILVFVAKLVKRDHRIPLARFNLYGSDVVPLAKMWFRYEKINLHLLLSGITSWA